MGIMSYGLSETTLEEVFLAVSAAAYEGAKARKQEAAKLHGLDDLLQDSSSAMEEKAGVESLDPKADAQLPSEEQPLAETPYTLIKVTLCGHKPCRDTRLQPSLCRVWQHRQALRPDIIIRVRSCNISLVMRWRNANAVR